MTATFDPTLASALDWMRDALGDVNTDAPFAPDETYTARLDDADDNWRLAAAAMARSFASRAINAPSSFTAQGDMAVSWGDRAAAWLKIAAELEAEATRLGTTGGTWTATVSRNDLVDDSDEYSVALRR